MSKLLKTISIVIAALVGLLVLVAIALRLFLDVNVLKPRFEAAVSEVFGMEVKVGGRLGIDFFPRLLVTLEDVRIRNRETQVVTAKVARIGVDFLPLLQKKVRIEKIELEHPRISIEKALDGKFNFEKPEQARGELPDLNLANISISDGALLYVNRQSGQGFEAANCSLAVRRLQLADRNRPGIMKKLSFAAELACGEVRTKDYAASGLKFSVVGQRGIFDLKPLTMRLFAGQGSGDIQADFTGAVPHYRARYSLSQFRIEDFLKNPSPQKAAEGPMDFSANLSMQGETVNKLKQTTVGHLSLRGRNLVLNGRNLDQEFARFEASQTFNLVDMGALLLVGPAGLVVTKGYDFADILQGSEGRSEIRTVVSDWKVERGLALSQDVAMATDKNRVALHGGLDFVDERFDNVTVALIDAKGCIRVQQKIRGSFKKPVIENPSALKSITGPVRKLLEQVKGQFQGGACEVFYAGSVAAPK